jgi:glutathione S-transferase
MMLTLYQLEWCPSCHGVRQVMTELGLAYMAVNVPYRREDRAQVVTVSGQEGVPVLQDGDRVLADAAVIAEYLRATYPRPDDAAEQAAMGVWRMSTQVSLSPHAALTRLRQTLGEKGFLIIAETPGREISERLPKGYVLLSLALPEAAAQAFAIDSLAAGAVLLAVAVVPTASGGSVVAAADPVGAVWLFADAPLRKVQSIAKRRLGEIFAAL